MALSKIDVANMVTGETPVANGGTGQTTLAAAGLAKKPNAKPLIINGDMMVAQRGTSTSGITGSDVFVVDRWRLDEGADSTITMSQETLSSGNAFDNGFLKSLKVLFTTADSSLASNQSVQLIQHVEAQDCQLFKYGTSNAVDLTLAFWYKSNVTGTHVVTLDKPDSTRTTCPVEFTVSSSGTWEHKVLNFNANDTIKGSSGAIANDNGTGLRVMWNLLYGSDYLSGTNGSWTQGGTGHFSTSNQQNIGGSNNNYVEVTGVQLEVGQFTSSTLPPFQHEDFGDNLQRCKRYFETQTGFYFFSFQSGTNVTHNAFINCKVEKRATPTGTYSGSAVNYYPNTGGGNSETNNVTAITIGDKNGSTFLRFDSEGDAPTDAGFYPIYADARNAVANWDAEL
jgi:hypothetical protein